MERLPVIQTKALLDKFLLRVLKRGNLPEFSKVLELMEGFVPGAPLTKPIKFNKRQRLAVDEIKESFDNIAIDIDVLYEIMDELVETIEMLEIKGNVIARRYALVLRGLEAEIRALTSYYSSVVYDTFTDTSQVDLERTTAKIDVAAGTVSLPEGGVLSKRVVPDVKGHTLPIGFWTDAEKHGVDKSMPFWYPFYGEGSWRHMFTSDADKVSFYFDIPLNASINGIILDTLDDIKLEFWFSQDNDPINFQPFPAIKPLSGRKRVSFPELYCTWVRVKGVITHKDVNGKFVLLINDIGFTNTGFSGTAKLVTEYFDVNNAVECKLEMDADIPTGCSIETTLEGDDDKTWILTPGSATIIGKAARYQEVLVTNKQKDSFETDNLYDTKNGINFYKIKLNTSNMDDVEGIIRGWGCMRARTFSDAVTASLLNVIRTSILKSRIVDLYRPREAVLASDAIKESTGTSYDYEVSVDENILHTDNMTYISTTAWGDTPFDYIQTRADNASIYYIKAYSSNGDYEYLDPDKVRAISGKTIYMSKDSDESLFEMSSINQVKVGYKSILTDKIINGSVSIFLNEDVELVEGKDYIVDYTAKQVILKKDFDGVLSIRFSIEVDTVDYTEFSTMFYLPKDLSIKLNAPLVLGKHDEVRIGGVRLMPGSAFPDLKAGNYAFVYKTADTDPLTALYNILTIEDTSGKMVFRDYFETPRLAAQSMKKVSIDYLLYNTFPSDRVYALVDGVYMVIPWLPYYSSLDDCVFPVSWYDDDGNEITTNTGFKSYITNHAERFYVMYNKKESFISGKHRLIFDLKRGDANTTPVIKSYRLLLR